MTKREMNIISRRIDALIENCLCAVGVIIIIYFWKMAI